MREEAGQLSGAGRRGAADWRGSAFGVESGLQGGRAWRVAMPTLESELTCADAPRDRLRLSQPWDVARAIPAGQTRTRVGEGVGESEPSDVTGEAGCKTAQPLWKARGSPSSG